MLEQNFVDGRPQKATIYELLEEGYSVAFNRKYTDSDKEHKTYQVTVAKFSYCSIIEFTIALSLDLILFKARQDIENKIKAAKQYLSSPVTSSE